MNLVDVEPIVSMTDRLLVELRESFRAAGFDRHFLAKIARLGERLDDPFRAPMRAWNARRLPDAAAVLARLFVLHDPVGEDEVARALGDRTPFVEAGLVDQTVEGLTSRTHLAFAGDLLVFGDRTAAGEGVPPLNGVTPVLARAAIPRRTIDSALDVGCGAGALSLAASGVADRVVASDVNPRALSWTRFNARLNGVGSIEVRHSDLFDGLHGERFELVLSQPPFLARRSGVAASTFAHAGDRGDELALRTIERAGTHLSPGGRAFVLADWPLLSHDPVAKRVGAALGRSPVAAFVLTSPAKNLDEYCTSLAAAEHPRLDEAFAAAACAHRDHFERLAVSGVAQALVVMAPSHAARTVALAVRHTQDAPITRDDIDRILASHALLAEADTNAVLGARLRLPSGSRLIEQPSVHGAPPAVIVQVPPHRPQGPVVVDPDVASLWVAIDRAATVLDAARAVAHRNGVALERITASVDAAARDAIARGALEVEGGP